MSMQTPLAYSPAFLDFDESNKARVQVTNNSKEAVKIKFRINNPPSGRIVSGPEQEQVLIGDSDNEWLFEANSSFETELSQVTITILVLVKTDDTDTETELGTLRCNTAFPKLPTEEFALQEYYSNKNHSLHLASAALGMFIVGLLLSYNHQPVGS